jgi:hypothetical protein
LALWGVAGRRAHAGTYDDHWSPMLSLSSQDFDERYFQAA